MPPLTPDPHTGHGAPIGFVKIPGVKGESFAKGHEGEIEIVAMNMGAIHSPGASSSGPVRTKVSSSDVTFSAITSTASPQLFSKSVYGDKLDTVVLTLTETNGKEVWEYLTVTLTDAVITSYQANVAHSEAEPVDTVTFGFKKIEFKVVASTQDHKPGPSTVTNTDLAAHKK